MIRWSSISIIYVYGYTSYKQNVKHASLSDDSSHYCVDTHIVPSVIWV